MIRGVEITVEVLDNAKEFFWECGAKNKTPLGASWEAIAAWKNHLNTDFSPRTRGWRAHGLAASRA